MGRGWRMWYDTWFFLKTDYCKIKHTFLLFRRILWSLFEVWDKKTNKQTNPEACFSQSPCLVLFLWLLKNIFLFSIPDMACLLKQRNLRWVWRSSPAEASVWCPSFLYYISMVAISYFIIARATLTPTPHSLLFISHRYAGQTEGESMIESAAWFTTVWEAVKRSIVCTWVCFCAWVSAFLRVDYTTQEMKPLYAVQTYMTSHNLELVCWCGCVWVCVFAVILACQMTKLHLDGQRQL